MRACRPVADVAGGVQSPLKPLLAWVLDEAITSRVATVVELVVDEQEEDGQNTRQKQHAGSIACIHAQVKGVPDVLYKAPFLVAHYSTETSDRVPGSIVALSYYQGSAFTSLVT